MNDKESIPLTAVDTQHPWLRIPAELRGLEQWAVAGPDKSPWQTNGARASVTDSTTWTTFDAAAEHAAAGGFHVGYMISSGDPLCCIDLDVCDEASQRRKGKPVKPEEWTTQADLDRYGAIIQHFDSYTELSTYGKGYHIWVRASIGAGCRRDGLEVYSQERFIVCTGNVCLDRPVADRQSIVDDMIGDMRDESLPPPLPDEPQTETDEAIIERAMKAANAEKFIALARGQWSPAYKSQSEADAGLMAIIAFNTRNNAQTRRIFRLTELGKRTKAVQNDRYLNTTLGKIRTWQARDAATDAARIEHGRQIFASIVQSELLKLLNRDREPSKSPEELTELSFDWNNAEPLPPDLVHGLVADEEVTLLGGHGGVGKGFLTLQICSAVARGANVLGHQAQERRVLYYSAEDGRKRLGHRMRRLIESYSDAEKALLDKNLCMVDATELNALYGEQTKGGGPTSDYALLQRMVEQFDPQLVVVDGASDTFDGNEIHRRDVRGFVKALKRLHPQRRIGVLLIVHIDRASARGHSSNDEGYAGNTQWHNSCRRRLYLQVKVEKDRETDTVLSQTTTLRVEKNQDGPADPDVGLVRDPNGFWLPVVQLVGAMAEQAAGPDPAETILSLIDEYYKRGKWIGTSLTAQSTTGVHPTLSGDPKFPPVTKKRTEKIVRQLERDGRLEVEEYKNLQRKTATRWKVVPPTKYTLPGEEPGA